MLRVFSTLKSLEAYPDARARIERSRPSEKEGDLVPFPIDQREAWNQFFHTFAEWKMRAIQIVHDALGDSCSFEDEGDITHGALEALILFIRKNPRLGEPMGEKYLDLVKTRVNIVSFQIKFSERLTECVEEGGTYQEIKARFKAKYGGLIPEGFAFPGCEIMEDPPPSSDPGIEGGNDGEYPAPA